MGFGNITPKTYTYSIYKYQVAFNFTLPFWCLLLAQFVFSNLGAYLYPTHWAINTNSAVKNIDSWSFPLQHLSSHANIFGDTKVSQVKIAYGKTQFDKKQIILPHLNKKQFWYGQAEIHFHEIMREAKDKFSSGKGHLHPCYFFLMCYSECWFIFSFKMPYINNNCVVSCLLNAIVFTWFIIFVACDFPGRAFELRCLYVSISLHFYLPRPSNT